MTSADLITQRINRDSAFIDAQHTLAAAASQLAAAAANAAVDAAIRETLRDLADELTEALDDAALAAGLQHAIAVVEHRKQTHEGTNT